MALQIYRNVPFLVKDYESESSSTPTGTTLTIDLATGGFHVIDLESASGDVTVSFTNTPEQNVGGSWVIKTIQGSTARNVTFSSTAFRGGVAPSLSTTEDDEDLVFLTWIDGQMYGTLMNDFSVPA